MQLGQRWNIFPPVVTAEFNKAAIMYYTFRLNRLVNIGGNAVKRIRSFKMPNEIDHIVKNIIQMGPNSKSPESVKNIAVLVQNKKWHSPSMVAPMIFQPSLKSHYFAQVSRITKF